MSKFVWSRSAIEALIRQWKKHRNLYNSKHKDFENITKTNESTTQIYMALKKLDEEDLLTVDEVKKKLNFLRIQYSREFLRHENTCRQNGQSMDDFYLPKLWCYEQLCFLRPDYECALVATTSKIKKEKPVCGTKKIVISAPKRIKRGQISEDLKKQLTTVEHLIQNRVVNNYKWLGKQVTVEMDEIEDGIIQEETSCAIQCLLRENVKSEEQTVIEEQNEVDSVSSNSPGFNILNELEHSTIDLKMELNENSDESLHEYSSQPEIDEMDLQRNSSKNSTNEETNFDDIAIDHNPLSPSNRRKSEPFEIDDIILEEDDIFLPKIQYVKEAIKENASPKFSRRLLSLHEEKTKAETIYFRKKAAYFQKQTDNLETQRKLMILQAQKLRLEIDQLRNDF